MVFQALRYMFFLNELKVKDLINDLMKDLINDGSVNDSMNG